MKKAAIGYARISTEDQSNWSLPGQVKDIEAHCLRNDIELLSVFEDKGQSAKSFDRASWRELEIFVKAHHRQIDFLIVMAYDRFSRNVSEALNMIEKLEKKYNVSVLSVTQPMPLHRDNPYYFMFRTSMLVNAELELRVIRDRAKTGVYRASKEGKFCRKAPIGYKNERQGRKSYILIDDNTAPFIREIYQLYLRNYSYHEIGQAMKKKGMKVESNGRIQRILSNPIYAGLIVVPKHYDEPEHTVKGQHEPLIDEGTWWKVQALMQKPKRVNTSVCEELPLRGVLKCSCGKYMTGAASKGEYKRYHYYWCTDHRKKNYNADKLHAQFDALIKELSLPQHYVEYLLQQTAKDMTASLQDNVQQADRLKKELKEVERNVDALEQKYLFEGLAKETYHKYLPGLQAQRGAIREQLNHLLLSADGNWKKYHDNLHRLSDIHFYYQKADTLQKQAFVNLAFERNLRYENGCFRTFFAPPFIMLKAASLKEKGLLVIEQPEGISEKNLRCAAEESPHELFRRMLDWTFSVVAA
jgi:DNA invertase Pin-like site-specific DNA recombinase